MSAATETLNMSPAYVPYSTFRAFVEKLHETALPAHIDRDLMSNLSGGTQSHLLISMRFLGLVEGSDDRVTDDLRQLVNSVGSDRWKESLHAVLKAAYADIIGDIDVETVTEKRLRKVFEDNAKLHGTVLDRSVRFFVKALSDAGVKVSPHVGIRRTRTRAARNSKGPKRNTARTPARPEVGGDSATLGLPGTNSLPVFLAPRRNGAIVFPIDVTEEECDKFTAAVEYLRQLVK